MARFAAVAFTLCAVLSAQVVVAQYGNAARETTASTSGSSGGSSDRFWVTGIEFAELKGVWKMEGMQMPQSQFIASEESAMPDCANDENGLPSYVGLDFDAARYMVIAGPSEGVNVMNVNQQRSTFSANSTFAAPFIVNTNARTGEKSCVHFQTYVDAATGELMAESLQMTIYTPNTTEGATRPIQTRPTCQLTGREKVGCYVGTEAELSDEEIEMAPAQAPTVAISSIEGIAPVAAPPSTDAITTVSKNTFSCQQGECLRLSPKHSTTSPAYGG